ncbi:hypothetical protein M426DRAFT_26782 [Hypoxylon sp. CI-4A]|nr:hypothetical protein M426DRAFT_26782 [Hypoxylon sp. CI-4A]
MCQATMIDQILWNDMQHYIVIERAALNHGYGNLLHIKTDHLTTTSIMIFIQRLQLENPLDILEAYILDKTLQHCIATINRFRRIREESNELLGYTNGSIFNQLVSTDHLMEDISSWLPTIRV